MGTKYRIFGTTAAVPPPAVLLERCRAASGRPLEADFPGAESEWFHGVVGDGQSVVVLDRWLADEDGIRAELNSWAAAVESWEGNADYGPLMERIIQSRQFVLLAHQGPAAPEPWPLELARLLAERSGGFYHV